MPITGRPRNASSPTPLDFSHERCRNPSRSAIEPLRAAAAPASSAVAHGRQRLPLRSLVLEDDLRDDPAPVVHQRHRLLEVAHREAVRHDRVEVEDAIGDQPDDARPGRRRVGDAADQGQVLARRAGRRGGSASVPRRRSRAARPGRPGGRAGSRARPRRGRPRSRRRGRARPRAGAPSPARTTSVAPSRARELELLLAHAVGDDPRRRVQPQERDRQRAERADADHADRLAGLRAAFSRPRRTTDAGSTRTPASKETCSGRRCTTCSGTATSSA